MQRHFDGMPREIKSISENYGHDMTFNLSPSSQISIRFLRKEIQNMNGGKVETVSH